MFPFLVQDITRSCIMHYDAKNMMFFASRDVRKNHSHTTRRWLQEDDVRLLLRSIFSSTSPRPRRLFHSIIRKSKNWCIQFGLFICTNPPNIIRQICGNPGALYPSKQTGEIWVGFFSQSQKPHVSHWKQSENLAKELLLASESTIAVFYWCGPEADAKIEKFRNSWSGVKNVKQRVHLSEAFCAALGGGKGKVNAEEPLFSWIKARDNVDCDGTGSKMWSPAFEHVMLEEGRKLDAIGYDNIFGDWARFGLAKGKEYTGSLREYKEVGGEPGTICTGSLREYKKIDFKSHDDTACSQDEEDIMIDIFCRS